MGYAFPAGTGRRLIPPVAPLSGTAPRSGKQNGRPCGWAWSAGCAEWVCSTVARSTGRVTCGRRPPATRWDELTEREGLEYLAQHTHSASLPHTSFSSGPCAPCILLGCELLKDRTEAKSPANLAGFLVSGTSTQVVGLWVDWRLLPVEYGPGFQPLHLLPLPALSLCFLKQPEQLLPRGGRTRPG